MTDTQIVPPAVMDLLARLDPSPAVTCSVPGCVHLTDAGRASAHDGAAVPLPHAA